MSGVGQIIGLADDHGWNLLEPYADDRLTMLWRWGPAETHLTRRELHIVSDAVGRIEAVSLWHNQRRDIRHQPGVRAYAERLIRGDVS